MSSATDRLLRWIIDTSAAESAERRATILRDAAKLIAGGDAASELLTIASEIEATDSRIKQLLLGFENGNGNGDATPNGHGNGGPQGPSLSEEMP